MAKKANTDGVSYVPAGEHNQVELNVQHLDETIVVDDGGFSTADPLLIAELDQQPTLERKTGRTKKAAQAAGVPPPPEVAEQPPSADDEAEVPS